ncbi:IclR family transcriptional regulator [Trinickia acidisoli]|uniref:IclR family transcriptional regulator n=1 Tax=Trinickia acidisoli TaxID=2767482 RepID=UPI001A8F9260|nr:IclR family transcriptional regulator [Trinickia acidisoli]
MSEAATISSVSHAVRLVELLARASKAMSVSELAKSLDLPRPTVYRLLRTLQSFNWTVQDGTTYRLSYRLPGLFAAPDDLTALVDRIKPLLSRLAAETRETVHFAVAEGDRVVYLAKVDSPHPIRMFSYVGWHGPMHATAVGKALLAWPTLSPAIDRICDEGLHRYTARTIVDKDSLLAELERTRARGYAVDDEELIDGLICLAAPVLSDDRVIGAISVAGPSNRMREIDTFASLLLACAAQ